MQTLHWVYILGAVVLLFGASIFVHEFGHLRLALLCGLKVEAFSIGFGPKLFSWKSRGVEYAWRAIPAGGFVALPQMVGSEMLEGKGADSPPLPPAPPWAKIVVALGGPAMNLLFAFLLATAIYFLGLPVRVNPAIIGGVEPGSPEAALGIRAGDRIVSVNGQSVHTWEEVQMTAAMAPTNVLAVTIQRGKVQSTYLLATKVNPELQLKLLNLDPAGHPVLERIVPGSAAESAGLKRGDEVVSFAGVPIVGEKQLVGLIQKRPGKSTQITVKRSARQISLQVTPRPNPTTGTGVLGAAVAPSAVSVYRVQKPGPAPWHLVAQVCRQTFDTVAALVHSKQTGVGVNDLSGPPGILAMLVVEVKTDFRLALRFMVLLNVSLAVLNLLPLPVLDGGHIAMAILEKLRGRPLSPLVQQYATMVFASLLIGFMAYVSYNDIVHRFPLFKSMFDQQVQIGRGSAELPSQKGNP